jgi:hypothetical protein
VENLALALGARLVTLSAGTPSDIEAAFTVVAEQRIRALIAGADLFFYGQRNQLAAVGKSPLIAIRGFSEQSRLGDGRGVCRSRSDAKRTVWPFSNPDHPFANKKMICRRTKDDLGAVMTFAPEQAISEIAQPVAAFKNGRLTVRWDLPRLMPPQ